MLVGYVCWVICDGKKYNCLFTGIQSCKVCENIIIKLNDKTINISENQLTGLKFTYIFCAFVLFCFFIPHQDQSVLLQSLTVVTAAEWSRLMFACESRHHIMLETLETSTDRYLCLE